METEAGNPSLKCKSSQVIKLIVQVTGHYHSVSLRQIVDADTFLKHSLQRTAGRSSRLEKSWLSRIFGFKKISNPMFVEIDRIEIHPDYTGENLL